MTSHFDAIIAGSGPAGATIARELSKRGKRVLVLERGGSGPLKEGFGMASIVNGVSVGDGLAAMRAFTTGGTTAVYFAAAHLPPLDEFRALGIDLSAEVEEAKAELPLTELPDEILGAQAIRTRQSATQLGYAWDKSLMLVDLSKCRSGYSYEAKWNARTYLREAVEHGATLVTRARVTKVLVEDGRAVGVEYELRKGKKDVETCRATAAKVVLSAGAAASPFILKNSGMTQVLNSGFYCHPNLAVFGTVPGLKGGENFVGSMGTIVDGNIALGDANVSRTFFRMMMLRNRRFVRAFQHSRTIGVGAMVREGLGGGLREDGRYYKQLQKDDLDKLKKGEEMARRIVTNAGGRDLFTTAVSSAQIGGTIRIRKHVDETLQTETANLHVCDGSIIPETLQISPTLTLICLGKYLAKHLSKSL